MVRDRLNKLLATRNIKPNELIEKTGVKKSIAYNLESRIDDIKSEDLSKIVVGLKLTKEEISELITGKQAIEIPDIDSFEDQKMQFDRLMLGALIELKEEIVKLRSELVIVREGKENAQGKSHVKTRQKVPEHH